MNDPLRPFDPFDDTVPYDSADPPLEPPRGCADPLLWNVSHALRRAHRPRADGWCDCGKFWPCTTFALADESLRAAYERPPMRQRARSSAANGGRFMAEWRG